MPLRSSSETNSDRFRSSDRVLVSRNAVKIFEDYFYRLVIRTAKTSVEASRESVNLDERVFIELLAASVSSTSRQRLERGESRCRWLRDARLAVLTAAVAHSEWEYVQTEPPCEPCEPKMSR